MTHISADCLFITATGTGIGKTLVTAAVCRQMRSAGRAVHALKPVISGYDPGDSSSDSALILRALGREVNTASVAEISPWRFAAPLSPHMAAAREDREIDLAELTDFCRSRMGRELLLIEGAGGVMTPLNTHHTMLDWIKALRCPAILVTGSYLGSLSHTLTALAALRANDIPVAGLVISESEGSEVDLSETAATLQEFTGNAMPVCVIPRLIPGAAPPDLTVLVKEAL